jgi:2-C-methyl-D-erythritol 4-phosphate cytidylyltransferase
MVQAASPIHLYVIIPAAGQGRRMGGTVGKQLIPIGGIPLLAKTLLAFSSFRAKMLASFQFSMHGILVAASDTTTEVQDLCAAYDIDYVERVVEGGVTRQESVWNAILSLPALARPPLPKDIVLVHDGARCFVDSDTILRCYHGALEHGVCTAAVPVKDTIKQVDSPETCQVVSTPERSTLYTIQTPQAFQYSLLYASYAAGHKEKRSATDDTSLAEAIGYPVFLVEGSYANIKITTKEDLVLAELLRKSQKDVEP